MDALELEFCVRLQDEGLGTLYERIVKGRMLRALADEHGYTDVLEFGCAVTRGFDNLAFLERGLAVTVADADIDAIQAGWRFQSRPAFERLESAPTADLVWNFAYVQRDQTYMDAVLAHARRHVLIFVPNVFNPGAPVHTAFHLLTRAPCRHAERGDPRLRTRRGLVRALSARGVRILASGYIDAPPLPNIAFSIRELKQALGIAQNGRAVDAPSSDPAIVWRRIRALQRFETHPASIPLRPLVAHHIFALGSLQ